MKIREQDLERYLRDLSESYAESSDYMRSKVESAYAQGVRQTVSHVFGLLDGSISVIYTEKESECQLYECYEPVIVNFGYCQYHQRVQEKESK